MIIKNSQKYDNRGVSYKGVDGRNIIRTLSNSDSLMSTICLETFVTGGRGYNAYKRGGVDELRERSTEDISAAIFWMKGVDIFNSIGDKFGKKVLKLPTTDFDVGRDALRNPFQNLSFNYRNEKNAKSLIRKLAAFKFTKIILSTILSTATIGCVIPRINQKITEKLMYSRQVEKQTLEKSNKDNSFEEFNKRISAINKVPSFKGSIIDGMVQISHTLENNTICKMLTNDAGIISGRAINARNRDEGIEYIFRDSSSLFFYFASTPLIYKGLQKLTNSFNLTEIDPVAARTLHNELIKQVNDKPMSVEEFERNTIGILDEKSKKKIEKLQFNKDVILLEDLKIHLNEEEMKRAIRMSELQPELKGVGRVLTKQQVIDVLKNTSITAPEFQHKIFYERFKEKLYDGYRYISMKKITSFRDNIDKYVQAVVDRAKKDNNSTVDKELLERINKESYGKSSKFRIFAMLVSALSLGFLIPKLQYAITFYRTGSNKAPGLREFENKSV